MIHLPTLPKDLVYEKKHPRFTTMVKELIDHANTKDYELVIALDWIKSESEKREISFYEMVYIVLAKHDNEKRAKDFVSQLQTIKENRIKTHCTNCSTEKIKGSNFCHKCGVTLA